jgi:hypothetical protein
MGSTASRPIDRLFFEEFVVSASRRVVMCSRNFVASVTNMKWADLLFCNSLLVGIRNRVASVASNDRQMDCHILIIDLAEGYELGLSSVRSAS